MRLGCHLAPRVRRVSPRRFRDGALRDGGSRPALRRCLPPIAAGLLTFAFAATAQVQRTADYLARMDTDGDGRVSLSEYQDWLSYAFDAMDHDRDGVLTAAELPGNRGRPVTRIEHRARLAERFGRQDRDRSGFLDATELAAPPR